MELSMFKRKSNSHYDCIKPKNPLKELVLYNSLTREKYFLKYFETRDHGTGDSVGPKNSFFFERRAKSNTNHLSKIPAKSVLPKLRKLRFVFFLIEKNATSALYRTSPFKRFWAIYAPRSVKVDFCIYAGIKPVFSTSNAHIWKSNEHACSIHKGPTAGACGFFTPFP